MTRSLIIVEGNIAAGKTTLCKNLAKRLNYKIFLEPHIENPYLALFYENPKKYALTLQLYMLKIRFETYVEALRMLKNDTEYDGILLDRSIFSDWVFAKMNYNDGNISEKGYQYYMQTRERMLKDLPIPLATIYLKVDPKVCLERIRNVRGVDCEAGIPIEYLQGLGDRYEEMLAQMKERGSSVAVFDWNDWNGSEQVADALITIATTKMDIPTPSLLNDQEEINKRKELEPNEAIELYF